MGAKCVHLALLSRPREPTQASFLKVDLQARFLALKGREIAVDVDQGERSAAEAEPAEGGGGFASEL